MLIDEYAEFVNPAWKKMLDLLNLDSPVVKAEGAYPYNEQGKVFLDFAAGFGAVCLGHNPPALIAQIREELETKPAYLNPFGYSRVAGKLAQKLLKHAASVLAKVYFSNTGAEAVESAIKFAKVTTQRQRILAVRDDFHGLTLWATQAAGNPIWRNNMEEALDYGID